MKSIEDMQEQFKRAYSGTSFSPEVRAEQCVAEFSAELRDDLQYLTENSGTTGNYEARYIEHLRKWVSAKSRCLSWMIAGPANFPVRRAEKASAAEDRAWTEFRSWRSRYIKRATAERVKSLEEDLDIALAELDKARTQHSLMLAANKIVRSKKLSIEEKQAAIMEETGFGQKLATALLAPAPGYGSGFPTFTLTNSNARIKRLEEKVLTMKSRIVRKEQWEPIIFDGGTIDIEDDRVVIRHDARPDRETIEALKSRGFRWAPSRGCWCRKHTANAIIAARQIVGV